MTRTTGALVLLCIAACGTKSEEPQLRQRGLAPNEAPPPAPPAATAPPAQAAPPPPSSLPSPFATRAPDPGALSAPPDAATNSVGAGPTIVDAGKDAGPERKLDRELAAIVGQPIRCLDLPAIVRAGGSLTISVRAQVMPSGRITRAEVSAPGQEPTAARCIEDLVKAGSLKGPVPGAPREVSSSTTIQASATP